MKKLVAVFILAVLIPSLILAGLAVRSLRDQEHILERQSALLHQSTTEALAGDVNVFMDDIRVYFRELVDELLVEEGVQETALQFDEKIRQRWAQVEVGAVVTDAGELISPAGGAKDARVQVFCDLNADFLTNRAVEEVYPAAPPVTSTIAVDLEEAVSEAPATSSLSSSLWRRGANEKRAAPEPQAKAESDVEEGNAKKEKVSVSNAKLRSRAAENKFGYVVANAPAQSDQKTRNIEPQSAVRQGQQFEQLQQLQDFDAGQNDLAVVDTNWSMLVTQRGEFRDIMGDEQEGAFSRFLQNRLHVLLWYRPPATPGKIFCAQLDLPMLKEEIGKIVAGLSPGKTPEVCLALIDETGAAVSRNLPGFETNWRSPFVATEIGEILPHWEIAAYLINPGSLNQAASSFRFTLGLMVFVLIAAIGLGSILIFADLARQTKLARQKTDFVSNVSHELKTPLTSIRMFSDLLSGDAAAAGEKRQEYAGIISSEAARLTRLINNLLDFSRLERGDKKREFQRLELGELVKETVDHYRDHLRSKGLSLTYDPAQNGAFEIEGDHDALSQVLLNLISNAEKYGGEGKEIVVEMRRVDGVVEILVLDRGDGVSRKDQDRIFKKFYRVDDSLSSGIQGSGLGLALARQIARSHGGDVVYRSREGGGSCFAIVLPVAKHSGEAA